MISRETFVSDALKNMQAMRQHCGTFHTNARDDFAFIAGDQWVPEDEQLLRQQNRPAVTFNYSEKMIDAVGGAEVSNRQETTYKARQIENMPLGELWTNAARWCRDECFAEDEETDAFRDALICGMGWIETRMDYAHDKDGMPIVGRNDPTEMFWDPAAIKPGLSDRRFDAHAAWMDDGLVRQRWPKALVPGPDMAEEPGGLQVIQTGNRYRNDSDPDDGEEKRRIGQTQIWHYQCMYMEPYYRVEDGSNGIADLETDDFESIQADVNRVGLKYVRTFRAVYYRGFFANDTCLEWGLSPCQDGFTRHCITGKRDRNKNLWYGLTRVMKDPQRWANKWLSQIMHIINSNAKGGLMAETNAFVDPRKAQDEWSSPDSVTLLNEGGLNKVKEKQQAPYPAGLAQLMEFALSSLPQVTGINLEALGLANRDQANVLEQSRKQAAYGLLAPVFDSLHRYRKEQGKIMLFFIRNYITDGRLVRVNGAGMAQYIPLTKIPDSWKFDIIVDQSPTAPDVQQRTWDALMQIVPAMIKAGMPIPPDLLTYAPLPTDLIQKWQKFIMDAQQQQQISPQQVQQMQQQMQDLAQQNQQLQQQLSDKSREIQLKAMEAQQRIELERIKTASQIQIDRQKADASMQIQAQSAANSMEIARKSQADDTKIKALQNGVPATDQGEIKLAVDTGQEAIVQGMAQLSQAIVQGFQQAVQQIVTSVVQAENVPKEVVRDQNGNIIGVRPVPQQ